jgi:hypothetical protein
MVRHKPGKYWATATGNEQQEIEDLGWSRSFGGNGLADCVNGLIWKEDRDELEEA